MRIFNVSIPVDLLEMVEYLSELDGGLSRGHYVTQGLEALVRSRRADLRTSFTTALDTPEVTRDKLFSNPVDACLEPHRWKVSEVWGLPISGAQVLSVKQDTVQMHALRRLTLAMLARLYAQKCPGEKPEIAEAICKQAVGRRELPRSIYRIGYQRSAALVSVQDVLINARQQRSSLMEIEIQSVAAAHRALLDHGVEPLSEDEARAMIAPWNPTPCQEFLSATLGAEYVEHARRSTGVSERTSG